MNIKKRIFSALEHFSRMDYMNENPGIHNRETIKLKFQLYKQNQLGLRNAFLPTDTGTQQTGTSWDACNNRIIDRDNRNPGRMIWEN